MINLKNIILFLVLFSAFSCKKEDKKPVNLSNRAGYFKSEPVAMGYGTLYSWIQFNSDGIPVCMGFTMSEDAIKGLSKEASTTHNHNDVFEVDLPKPAKYPYSTPFDHIAINWNAAGHVPSVYVFPHFDCHFYTMTSAERHMIPAFAQDSMKFKNYPSSDYFPANYVPAPGGEPEMGSHWVDVTSPELNGGKFTQTFIYGSYDGKVNFLEPMITLEFLKQTTYFTRSIPRPLKVQKTGYYPYKMSIVQTKGEYSVVLDSFEYRIAS
jgi:hypothetical protein